MKLIVERREFGDVELGNSCVGKWYENRQGTLWYVLKIEGSFFCVVFNPYDENRSQIGAAERFRLEKVREVEVESMTLKLGQKREETER